MSVNVRIRNGLCPDLTTGDGGATEGDIRGSFSDIIDVVGVKDLAGGHCLVTENSPQGLSVLIADGIVYIPNADYDELDSNEPKFYEAILKDIPALEIAENTSGSTRIDLVCVKIDKTIVPDEHASNISTPIIVQGTPGAGAPTLPDNHSQLAEVEVANGASTIVNADITDSRVQSTINSDYVGASVSVTTKGDLQTYSTTPARLPVGSDGYYPIADSSQTTGLKYKAPDGWNEAFETWEYVSVDDPTGVFRVNADVTGKYSVGMRIKMTNGGNIIYGIITVVGAYTGGYTSITFLHQIDPTDNLALVLMANSAITSPYFSTQKAPFGFPLSPTKWTVEVTDSSFRQQSSPTANTWYNLGSVTISVPIGCWSLYYIAIVQGQISGNIDVKITLSTANNSESDADYTSACPGYTNAGAVCYKPKTIILSSKTSYYLNELVVTSSASNLFLRSDLCKTVIRAVCAYL